MKLQNNGVAIEGKVKSVTPENFTLDYGNGELIVDMDDFNNYGNIASALKGDKVTVFGKTAAVYPGMTEFDADSVWVNGMNTYFYAKDATESDFLRFTVMGNKLPAQGFAGEITDVDSDQFTMKTPEGTDIDVNIEKLGYNPFDDEGFQKLKVGDRVWVAGSYDRDLLSDDEMEATHVVTMQKAVQ